MNVIKLRMNTYYIYTKEGKNRALFFIFDCSKFFPLLSIAITEDEEIIYFGEYERIF